MNIYLKKGLLSALCGLIVSTSGAHAVTQLKKLTGVGIGAAAFGTYSAIFAKKNMEVPSGSPRSRSIQNFGKLYAVISVASFSYATYCARCVYKIHNNKKVIQKVKGT